MKKQFQHLFSINIQKRIQINSGEVISSMSQGTIMRIDQKSMNNSRRKQKLPLLNKKFQIKSDMHNQSLIKLRQNEKYQYNMAQFPILKHEEVRVLNFQNSIHSEKNYHLLENSFSSKQQKKKHVKRTPKMHTEGRVDQPFTQMQESFVSLTNKPQLEQQDVTMINFKKKIQLNKKIIKQQIEKKNKQNQFKDRISSFVKKKRVNSSKIIESSTEKSKLLYKKTIETPSRKSIEHNSRSRQQKLTKQKKKSIHLPSKKNLTRARQKTQFTQVVKKSTDKKTKRQSQGLFTDLQIILDEKTRPQPEKEKKEENKLKSLLEKLYRCKKEKTQSFQQGSQKQLIDQICGNVKQIKKQTNYKEWNKIDISSTSQISYRKSSFEEQLRKVSQYTDRNDASLEKYLEMRKQLLKYGFQAFHLKKGK